MTRKKGTPPSNVAHSVKARLLQRARRDGEDFNSLLVRYVLERLLYRLGVSPHANEFVLKGALLFVVWSNQAHRATKDLDLLGSGPPEPARLARIFAEISEIAAAHRRPPNIPDARPTSSDRRWVFRLAMAAWWPVGSQVQLGHVELA